MTHRCMRWQSALAAAVLAALTAGGCSSAPPTAPGSPPPTAATPATEDTASPSSAPLSEEEALAAARERRAARDDCDAGFADEAHSVLAEVDGRMLVHVVCYVGAYQPSGELRAWDGTTLAAIPVEQWQAGEVVDQPEVVGSVDATPDGTTVFNDVKYRGLGDCGLHQRWSFDGTALVLEEAREQECSDDGEFVPPPEWPVVYSR